MSDPSEDGGRESDDVGWGGTEDARDAGADGSGSAGVDPSSPWTVSDSPLRAVGVAVGLGTLGIVFVLLFSLVVSGVGMAIGGLSLAVSLGLSLLLGQYVAFGGVAFGYLRHRGFDRSGIVSYLGVRRPSLKEIGLVVGGWVLILVMVVVISTILQLLGPEPAANQSAEIAMQNPAIIPLLIAASFLVIGPAEEVLYRGIVQSRLRESISAVPAIAIASAIFAAVHVIALTGGLEGRLTTIAVLFFPSLVFGAVYEYTDNIVVPALLHGLHNAVIFTLLYVAVAYADEFEELAEGAAMIFGI
ncbi:membrane protease YdiL (CAAX protease family) [Halorubrum alkaliphilum]|uniref:Membrane protease YdiL (CAAX protease family) n=1 Tax=Halorubrum alkaliphilum TaxID=261290 RepID=A0A8T4GGF0_9EURY|nr:CPBP family intramembrane glutamic endopeptidase [Halorubrum alkaliphilum]MBP1922252.1 membrane protease YdiL (CAAX protease family) [Halorubrum alkaliphilum]